MQIKHDFLNYLYICNQNWGEIQFYDALAIISH